MRMLVIYVYWGFIEVYIGRRRLVVNSVLEFAFHRQSKEYLLISRTPFFNLLCCRNYKFKIFYDEYDRITCCCQCQVCTSFSAA